MDDVISRKAAIDSVEVFLKQTDAPEVYPGLIPALVRVINNMPSAQPEKRTDKRMETHSCDCISRQAAIDAHYEYCNKHPDASFPVWSLKILENLPSAQPEIILCKDCAHWKHSTVRPSYCEVWDWQNAENDYCSFAERRTDDCV